ncbi:hypothetical protein LINPERHAP1_LOCUS31582 [Linum perenne]
MEVIRRKIGFDGCVAVDVVGHSGGLAILWRSASKARLLNFHRNFINMEVDDDDIGRFNLTGFYGIADRNRRHESWDMLRNIASQHMGAWCCMGDFNDLLDESEKRGTRDHPPSLMAGFRSATLDSGLTDVDLDGYPFPSHRGTGASKVEERLDRAMANREWHDRYQDATLTNLVAPISDHTPILLNTSATTIQHKPFRFRYEIGWIQEAGFRDVVTNASKEQPGSSVMEKLSCCIGRMESWSADYRTRFTRQIREGTKRMEELR